VGRSKLYKPGIPLRPGSKRNPKHTVREEREIVLHPKNMNREEAFTQNRSWKALFPKLSE
jgi:hypothetical protein